MIAVFAPRDGAANPFSCFTQYVVHFPKGEKYVSLLREAEDEEGQELLAAERERLRGKVRAALADRALVAEADEGRSLAAARQGLVGPAAQVQNCLFLQLAFCTLPDKILLYAGSDGPGLRARIFCGGAEPHPLTACPSSFCA